MEKWMDAQCCKVDKIADRCADGIDLQWLFSAFF